MSANVACGQVKYAPDTHEELDMLAAAGGGASVYATAEDTTATTTRRDTMTTLGHTIKSSCMHLNN